MSPNLVQTLNNFSSAWMDFMASQVLYSSIVFFIIFGISQIFRNKSVWLHFALWGLVLLRFILPPNFSWEYSLRAIFNEPVQKQVNSYFYQPENEFLHVPVIETESLIPETQPPINANEQSISFEFQNPKNEAEVLQIWPILGFFVWILGVVLVFGFVLSRSVNFRQIQRSAKLVKNDELVELLNFWKSHLRIRRNVKLLGSEFIASPCTTGVFSPKIYLPKSLIQYFAESEIEPILAHELVHIKRFDFLLAQLQNFIAAIYFFHPVAWFTNSKLNTLREQLCDETVLSFGKISSKFYSSVMLKVVQNDFLASRFQPGTALAFGNQKKSFMGRIKHMLQQNSFRNRFSWKHVFVAFLFATLILPMGFKSENNLVGTRWVGTSDAGSMGEFVLDIKKLENSEFEGILYKYSGTSYLAKNVFWNAIWVKGTASDDSLQFQEIAPVIGGSVWWNSAKYSYKFKLHISDSLLSGNLKNSQAKEWGPALHLKRKNSELPEAEIIGSQIFQASKENLKKLVELAPQNSSVIRDLPENEKLDFAKNLREFTKHSSQIAQKGNDPNVQKKIKDNNFYSMSHLWWELKQPQDSLWLVQEIASVAEGSDGFYEREELNFYMKQTSQTNNKTFYEQMFEKKLSLHDQIYYLLPNIRLNISVQSNEFDDKILQRFQDLKTEYAGQKQATESIENIEKDFKKWLASDLKKMQK